MMIAFVVCGNVMTTAAVQSVWPIPVPGAPAMAGGVVLALAGAALCIAARVRFSFSRTWGLEMDSLVTAGAYRITRNPQLLGWFLVYCGVGLLGRSAATLVLATLF